MTNRAKFALAIVAILMASVTAAVVESFPFPFYVGLFIVGPLAFLWFVVPGLLVPLLVSKLPVSRKHLPKVITLTLLGFAASFAYLRLVPSHDGNMGGEIAIWGLWIVAPTLALLAAAGYFRESRGLTTAYYLVLSTWFCAIAFPYLGEFCC
ncbi:MAG TPA: hypothetical protein VMO26_17140 [Vicinamibacterales bacterium]|nr:hypothetical protein [Vicinamibacterales bacterium]